MFKLLRSRAKFFYWIIAVSFILFTFIVWGAQCNSNPRVKSQAPRVIGSVNGVEITWDEWDFEYKQYLAQYRQQLQGQALSSNQRAQAIETVWNNLINSKIADVEIKTRKLELSNNDVLDILKNNPPQPLLQQYTDENGRVNMDAYYADLANPERDWTNIEAYLRNSVPFQRLSAQITADVTVSEQEVRDEYYRQNGRAIAEYVGLQLSNLTLESEPLEADIAAYYNTHLDEYMEPERVVVEYVSWLKQASTADIDAVRSLAEDVRREILSGELDFAEAAAIYSDDGSREEGGDLGRFDRNRMVAPFTDVAFSLKIGDLSEPVLTRFGYHIIEVLEVFETDGVINEIHARHILFNIDPSEDTLTDLYTEAESFGDNARDIGFREAAADAALEATEPAAIKPARDLPTLRDTIQASNFSFSAKPGAISRVFENDDVYYMVHVIERLPEAPAELVTVRSRVLSALSHERKLALAKEKMNPAVGALQMKRPLAEVADEFNLEHALTDTFSIGGNITGVGYNTDFNKAVLENDTGTLIDNVETGRGIYALMPIWKSEFNEEDFLGRRDDIFQRLMQQRQYETLNEWFENKVDAAKIIDNRAFLFAGS